MKKTILYATIMTAFAMSLSGCIVNPVKVEHATITIHADKVAQATPQ